MRFRLTYDDGRLSLDGKRYLYAQTWIRDHWYNPQPGYDAPDWLWYLWCVQETAWTADGKLRRQFNFKDITKDDAF